MKKAVLSVSKIVVVCGWLFLIATAIEVQYLRHGILFDTEWGLDTFALIIRVVEVFVLSAFLILVPATAGEVPKTKIVRRKYFAAVLVVSVVSIAADAVCRVLAVSPVKVPVPWPDSAEYLSVKAAAYLLMTIIFYKLVLRRKLCVYRSLVITAAVAGIIVILVYMYYSWHTYRQIVLFSSEQYAALDKFMINSAINHHIKEPDTKLLTALEVIMSRVTARTLAGISSVIVLFFGLSAREKDEGRISAESRLEGGGERTEETADVQEKQNMQEGKMAGGEYVRIKREYLIYGGFFLVTAVVGGILMGNWPVIWNYDGVLFSGALMYHMAYFLILGGMVSRLNAKRYVAKIILAVMGCGFLLRLAGDFIMVVLAPVISLISDGSFQLFLHVFPMVLECLVMFVLMRIIFVSLLLRQGGNLAGEDKLRGRKAVKCFFLILAAFWVFSFVIMFVTRPAEIFASSALYSGEYRAVSLIVQALLLSIIVAGHSELPHKSARAAEDEYAEDNE